jgi:hypothetical protein
MCYSKYLKEKTEMVLHMETKPRLFFKTILIISSIMEWPGAWELYYKKRQEMPSTYPQ